MQRPLGSRLLSLRPLSIRLASGLALALVPVVSLACAAGSGDDVSIEDQAAAGQALIDGGDTIEDAPGGSGDDAVDGDDEVALDEADDSGECHLAQLRERVINRYDEDDDGTLSQDEREAMRADVEDHPRLERALSKHRVLRRVVAKRIRFVYDLDGSNSLDETERATLKSDLEARCIARQAQVLERYDVDGDGVLSDAERLQLRTDRQARIAERRAELKARFDVDGSGRLEPAERQALRDDVRARVQARRAALKARFDVDGDGVLSDDEKNALREHLRARIRLEEQGDEETSL